jgi:hypothetical protein
MARYRRIDVKRPAVESDPDAMQSVRMRRAGLKSAMSGLEIAIAAPAPGRVYEWARGVRDAVVVVHEVWTRHVVETEAPGAFLDELVEAAPRLSKPALRLREEHGEILSILLAVEDRLAVEMEDVEWAESLRSDLTALLVALARHRQRGADLVYEAYDVDIGGG